MKNLTFILLVAATLLSATNSFASPRFSRYTHGGERIKLLSNEEFFSKSDYIIEAKISDKGYIVYDAGGNYKEDELYTSLFLIVTYVYKNDETMSISPGDTLHYIRKGGAIDKPSEERPIFWEVIRTPPAIDYDTGERESAMAAGDYPTIYFMKKSDFPENPDTSKRSKHPKVSMLQDIKRAAIRIDGTISGLNDLHFENRYELYKYMEQFEGVTVPLSDPWKMHWDLFGLDGVFEQYLKERNVEWRDFYGPQYIDSVEYFMEMKAKKAAENTERKKKKKGY